MTEDSQIIFNEPEPAKAQRGRRESLDQDVFERRRHRLFAMFEGFWGEIGWKLQTCKSAGDLVGIFSALPGAKNQDVLTVFCTPSTLAGSGVEWRQVRAQLRALIEPQSDASNLNVEALDRLQKAQAALAQAQGRELKQVRKEFAERKREADAAADQLRRINTEQRKLTATLDLMSASIAQDELFRFLRDKRYQLTPLSLANAAAGLPELSYRTSTLKFARRLETPPESARYETFKAIRYLISTAPDKTAKTLIPHFHERVHSLPQRYSRAKEDLAENWLFIERALRETCKAKPHPGAFPFEVTARYFRKMTVQSYTDRLLAERKRINLRTTPFTLRGKPRNKRPREA